MRQIKRRLDYYDIFIYAVLCSIFMYAQWFNVEDLFTISWEVWLDVAIVSGVVTMLKVGLDWIWTKF